MVLLLICSVVSLTVMILRGLALRRNMVMPEAIEQEIENLQPGDDTDAIVKLARLVRSDESPLARIAQVGLQHLQWPKSENIEAVQTKARHEVVHLESGLFILEIIVGIAPLLGLLGAVSGLVSVFADFSEKRGQRLACHREGHFRGAEHHDRGHRGRHPESHRLQLFREEGRGHGHRNGDAHRGPGGQVLLPEKTARSPRRGLRGALSSRHEILHPPPADADSHHRFADRYFRDPAHLRDRHDDFQKGAAQEGGHPAARDQRGPGRPPPPSRSSLPSTRTTRCISTANPPRWTTSSLRSKN